MPIRILRGSRVRIGGVGYSCSTPGFERSEGPDVFGGFRVQEEDIRAFAALRTRREQGLATVALRVTPRLLHGDDPLRGLFEIGSDVLLAGEVEQCHAALGEAGEREESAVEGEGEQAGDALDGLEHFAELG